MSGAVVKLPTAARRQVRQPQNKEARAAKRALRDQQGQSFPFRYPSRREADSIAEAIHPMTPERWLLLGILHSMSAEQFARLAQLGIHSHPTIQGLIRLAKGGVGLNIDVMGALERLRS